MTIELVVNCAELVEKKLQKKTKQNKKAKIKNTNQTKIL